MEIWIKRLGIVACLAARAAGGTDAAESPAAAHVVELYTSQGCSSCPPADSLLGELAKRPDVIALAIHVDYWDNIGWRDRFEIAPADERQRRYVDNLGLSSGFTPQVVIDGRLSLVGSDRLRITAALERGAAAMPSHVPALSLRVDAGTLRIDVPESDVAGDFDIVLAAFLPQASTAVGRGENSGRMLTEYNIVRELKTVGSWSGRAVQVDVPVASIASDATRVGVFLQRRRQGPIIAARVADLR
jgi:hypothetical protein